MIVCCFVDSCLVLRLVCCLIVIGVSFWVCLVGLCFVVVLLLVNLIGLRILGGFYGCAADFGVGIRQKF